MPDEKHIVVIGAGVIGLQIANTLLDAGYDVTILAKHFPGDLSIEYTSPWAGAHWRSHASIEDVRQQRWDLETYNYWLSLLGRELNEPENASPKTGLGLCDSVFYSTSNDQPWFSKAVLGFQELHASQLPDGMASGHCYSTIMINVPQYLQFLLDNAMEGGATICRASLPTSSSFSDFIQAAESLLQKQTKCRKATAFVNATGIAAKDIVPDSNIYPISGQTITVRGTAKGITTVDASPTSMSQNSPTSSLEITYVLPRPNSETTILGGTKGVGDWSGEPNPETTRRMLKAAKRWAPELLDASGEFEVLSVQVGLRPGRKGGARVELEELLLRGHETMPVVHAYGAAGAGFQNSVGVATRVLTILEQHWNLIGAEAIAKL